MIRRRRCRSIFRMDRITLRCQDRLGHMEDFRYDDHSYVSHTFMIRWGKGGDRMAKKKKAKKTKEPSKGPC